MEKVESMLKIDIKKKFFGENAIISDLNVCISQGECVSILGKSGIGKSTLLKIISGLDSDYQGQVTLDENEISSPTKDVTLMMQNHKLLLWLKVKDNIKFINSHISDLEITEYLKKVGIPDKFDEWPNRLSGGEKTRVAIAVAFINHSKVLLLDEPFADIDIGIKKDIWSLLSEIRSQNNSTILMTTHHVEDALSISDRVLVLGNNPSSIVFDSKNTNDNKEQIKNILINILS